MNASFASVCAERKVVFPFLEEPFIMRQINDHPG